MPIPERSMIGKPDNKDWDPDRKYQVFILYITGYVDPLFSFGLNHHSCILTYLPGIIVGNPFVNEFTRLYSVTNDLYSNIPASYHHSLHQ